MQVSTLIFVIFFKSGEMKWSSANHSELTGCGVPPTDGHIHRRYTVSSYPTSHIVAESVNKGHISSISFSKSILHIIHPTSHLLNTPLTMAPNSLTWFITGTSSGFGEIFVKQILARGDKAIATARSLSKIQHLKAAGASILELDVTAPQPAIDAKAREALAIYGGIDVLVNNAGYAALGTLEDVTPDQWADQFNTNVFGVVNVTRAFMPHFRGKKDGFVVFIGSVGGWNGSPVGGPYCSSKFALEGSSDLLPYPQ